ncbi:hypothetical protein V6Z11_D01G148700 [Gossypium hirsutum]
MPVQFVGSSILPGMKLMKGTIPFFTRISLLGFNLVQDCSAAIYINTIVAKKEVCSDPKANRVFEEFEK